MLGLQEGRNVSIRCPHPEHRDTNPSFLVRRDNSFKCFGKCGTGGRGWIDFCKFMGFDFKSIMEEYAVDRTEVETVNTNGSDTRSIGPDVY